jgi:hypothetical protein
MPAAADDVRLVLVAGARKPPRVETAGEGLERYRLALWVWPGAAALRFGKVAHNLKGTLIGVAGTLVQDVCFEGDLISYCDANGSSLATNTGLR